MNTTTTNTHHQHPHRQHSNRLLLFAGLIGLGMVIFWIGNLTGRGPPPPHLPLPPGAEEDDDRPPPWHKHHPLPHHRRPPPRHRLPPPFKDDDDEFSKDRFERRHHRRPLDEAPDGSDDMKVDVPKERRKRPQQQLPTSKNNGGMQQHAPAYIDTEEEAALRAAPIPSVRDAANMKPSPSGNEILRVARERFNIYIHPAVAIMKHPLKGNTLVSKAPLRPGTTIIAVPESMCLSKSESTKRMLRDEIRRRKLMIPWGAEDGGNVIEGEAPRTATTPPLFDFDLYFDFAVNASAQTPLPALMPHKTAKACLSPVGMTWYQETVRPMESPKQPGNKQQDGDDVEDDDDSEEPSALASNRMVQLDIAETIFRLRAFSSVGLAPIVDLFSADSKGGSQILCYPHTGDFFKINVTSKRQSRKTPPISHPKQLEGVWPRRNMIAWVASPVAAGDELFIDYGARHMKTQLFNYGFMDPLSATPVPRVKIDRGNFTRRAKRACDYRVRMRGFAITASKLEPTRHLRDCIALQLLSEQVPSSVKTNAAEPIQASNNNDNATAPPIGGNSTKRNKKQKKLPHQRAQSQYMAWVSANIPRQLGKSDTTVVEHLKTVVLPSVDKSIGIATVRRWIGLLAAAYERIADIVEQDSIPFMEASSTGGGVKPQGEEEMAPHLAPDCESQFEASTSRTSSQNERDRTAVLLAAKVEKRTLQLLKAALPSLRRATQQLRDLAAPGDSQAQ